MTLPPCPRGANVLVTAEPRHAEIPDSPRERLNAAWMGRVGLMDNSVTNDGTVIPLALRRRPVDVGDPAVGAALLLPIQKFLPRPRARSG